MRYCSAECQRGDWKEVQGLHAMIVTDRHMYTYHETNERMFRPVIAEALLMMSVVFMVPGPRYEKLSANNPLSEEGDGDGVSN